MFVEGIVVMLILMPVLLIVTCCSCWRLFGVKQLPVGEVAELMVRHWQEYPGSAAKLPEFLQGVFWMSDNPAPEMLVCFMGEEFDPVTRRLTVRLGREYGWSYNNTVLGWLEYLVVSLMGLGSTIIFQFNEDYSYAELPVMMFGCFPSNRFDGRLFTMKRQEQDGDAWDRITLLNGQRDDFGSYTLRRVMDKDGKKLPAFQDMLKQVEDGTVVKGTTAKTKVQTVQVSRGLLDVFACWRRSRRVAATTDTSTQGLLAPQPEGSP